MERKIYQMTEKQLKNINHLIMTIMNNPSQHST